MSVIRAQRRRSAIVLVMRLQLGLGVAWASPAQAQNVDQCIESTAEGQKLRDGGDLIGAEQQFVQCASNACPAVIRQDCQNWLSELGPSIPSLRLVLKSEGGNQGRVLLDGRQVRVSSSPIRVNPGEHEIQWELEGHETSVTSVTIGVGSRGKVVEVAPGPKLSAEKREEGFSLAQVPTVSWVLGGVGVAAIGGFAAMGIVARSEFNSLQEQCGDDCPPELVDPTKNLAIAADVFLGVGILAIGTGTVLAFVLPNDEPNAPPRATAALSVGPTPGGFALGVTGSF